MLRRKYKLQPLEDRILKGKWTAFSLLLLFNESSNINVPDQVTFLN